MQAKVDWEALRESRIEKTQSMMKKNKVDLLLLTALENVRYVTDVKPVFGIDYAVDGYAAVVPAEGRPTLIRPYAGENPLQLPEVSTSKYVYVPLSGMLVSKEWAELFAKVLQNSISVRGRPVRIGVDHLSFETYSDLQSRVKGTYVPIMKEMLEARAVKLPEEIKLMREAARVLDVGMEAAAKELKPGVSEFKVGGSILDAMAREGIEQVPFWPVVVSGKTPPGAESSGVFTGAKKIDREDVVIIDFGCHVKGGYSGDYGRVFFLDNHSRAKELYEALYDVIMNGIRKARPGVNASELDDACRQVIKERGYEDPEPEIGHGLGLKVAELPRITRPAEARSTGTDMKLEAGMIVNLEPIVHVPKTMWMWVENTMLITESGSEVLTKFPFEPS